MTVFSKSSKKTFLSGLIGSSMFGMAATQQNIMYAIFIVSLVLSFKLLNRAELLKFFHEIMIGALVTLVIQMYQAPESDPIRFAIQILSLKLILIVLYVWEIVVILKRPP